MILVFCSLLFASIFAATSHFAKRDFFLYISILFSLISCGLSFALIQHINFESTLDNSVFKFYELYRFTFINDNNTSIGFRIDILSSIWIITSNIICLFTCLYSIFYMKKSSLFITYNNLFALSLILFVSSNNWLQMFIGMELMSLISYILINFYNDSNSTVKDTSFHIFLINKFGDVCFLIGMLISAAYLNTFNFKQGLQYFQIFNMQLSDIFIIFMLISASVKSAQFGFMRWLTNAMIAPTPASAFLHGATIVSAGVFLLARIESIYQFKYQSIVFALYFFISALFAAALSLKENDIKKILAYSTICKISFMLFACLMGNVIIAILFFVIHAFEKCLLFFCAGNVSKALSNERDITKMGGLMNMLPKTYSLTLLSVSLYLGVIPLVVDNQVSGFAYMFYAAEVLSIFCIIRMLYLVFHGNSNIDDRTSAYLSDDKFSLLYVTAACVIANIFVRFMIWLYIPNKVSNFSLKSYLINLAIVVLCACIYRKYKFTHLIDFVKSFTPINISYDTSRITDIFRSLQRMLESFSYRFIYISLLRFGKLTACSMSSYNTCVIIGSILILIFILNFSGSFKWLQMMF